MVAGFALQASDTLSRNDGNHDQARSGVSPPKIEQSVEQQSIKKDAGEVCAKFRLFGIDVRHRAGESAMYSIVRGHIEESSEKFSIES